MFVSQQGLQNIPGLPGWPHCLNNSPLGCCYVWGRHSKVYEWPPAEEEKAGQDCMNFPCTESSSLLEKKNSVSYSASSEKRSAEWIQCSHLSILKYIVLSIKTRTMNGKMRQGPTKWYGKTAICHRRQISIKMIIGLPWWCSGWESACQCRGHGFEPWSGKIPHAAEQLGPCVTTTEPARLEPVLHNQRGRDSERPAHRDEEWPLLAATRESPRTETKTRHSQK